MLDFIYNDPEFGNLIFIVSSKLGVDEILIGMVYEAPWERYCHPQIVFQAKSEENPQNSQMDRIKRLYIFYDNIDIAGLSELIDHVLYRVRIHKTLRPTLCKSQQSST
jgi:hypothetical protein